VAVAVAAVVQFPPLLLSRPPLVTARYPKLGMVLMLVVCMVLMLEVCMVMLTVQTLVPGRRHP
jgi:hypothetical protein